MFYTTLQNDEKEQKRDQKFALIFPVMPKKGKKGKGKKKGKKKSKGPANSDEIVKRLLKCYERNCYLTDSQMCPGIRKAMLGCIENKAILPQV